ncbi:hypothetical protein F0562_010720 [Nyssa sinensis]|uniref:Peptidase C1A papain C-terminal domain-containing protein n=1 Tax=Nyssa sinensis TaxID=561372 RepID=A0A5J5A4S6_9ASTE|nr:hypothetical protein F0562_010720 [Nyssa sinensis]
MERIESFNKAMNKPYKLGVNEFADLTNEEFIASHNRFKSHVCQVRSEDQGCEGGLMDNAYQFIQQNQGLTTETTYPNKGVDGTCNANKEANHATKITGHEDVPANSETALLKAVANQPVSVAIDARGFDFQFYSSGVFTGQCGTDLDHGITAVGYGTTEDGTKYWLVKNSRMG